VESFSKKVSGHVAEEEYRRFWKKWLPNNRLEREKLEGKILEEGDT